MTTFSERPVTPLAPRTPPGPPPAGPESVTGRHDLPVLEAYRGLASVAVVVTHVGFTSGAGVNGAWAGWLSRLDFGVALFFLLSGFLLFRPFVQASYGKRPPVAVGAYLRRRFVRIYPALIIAIAANYVLTPDARKQSAELWWQTVFLVQNYPSNFNNQLHGLVQLWSLVVEVSFYAALPILAWVIVGLPRRRKGDPEPVAAAVELPSELPSEPSARPMSRRELRELEARQKSGLLRARAVTPVPVAVAGVKPPTQWRVIAAFAAMVVIALAWRYYFVEIDNRDRPELRGTAEQLLWLPPFLDWFAGGMAMAWLRERPAAVPARIKQLADAPGVCWSLALAGYWLTTTSLGGPMDLEGATTGQNFTKHITYLVIGTLLLLPAIFGDPRQGWRATLSTPFFIWLGQVSFGVFLWHPMLMELIRDVLRMEFGAGGFWLTLVLTLAFTGVVATLSFRLVEAPLQKRFRNGFGLRRA